MVCSLACSFRLTPLSVLSGFHTRSVCTPHHPSPTILPQIDVALDWNINITAPFTPQRILDEVRGIADASGTDYQMLLRMNLFPELTKASCSFVGAWGAATSDGHSYQVRALDFDTDGPFRDFAMLTVYHPSDGHAFANVGWPGQVRPCSSRAMVPRFSLYFVHVCLLAPTALHVCLQLSSFFRFFKSVCDLNVTDCIWMCLCLRFVFVFKCPGGVVSSDPTATDDQVGALTGYSSAQIGISEIGVAFPDDSFGQGTDHTPAQKVAGKPWMFVLRDVLQFSTSLADAEASIAAANRTCNLIIGVGDGQAGVVNGIQYSGYVAVPYNDTTLLPANATWHPQIPSVVYNGMDWYRPLASARLSFETFLN